jgi:hypothetical protein
MKMKKLLLGALLAAMAVPASAQKVEVAEGDWSKLPLLKSSRQIGLSSDVVDKIHGLVISGQCKIPNVSKRRIDMTVPFLVRFDANGGVEHVVVRKLGCDKAEGILAAVVLDWAKYGMIRSTAVDGEGWYRSEISFSSVS